jgi:cell division protease FtsH
VLDDMVLELIEKETITQDDMNRICARVAKRAPMAPFNGFGKRLPSEAPPVLTPAERDKLKAQAEADGQIAVGGPAGPNSGGNANGTAEGSH